MPARMLALRDPFVIPFQTDVAFFMQCNSYYAQYQVYHQYLINSIMSLKNLPVALAVRLRLCPFIKKKVESADCFLGGQLGCA